MAFSLWLSTLSKESKTLFTDPDIETNVIQQINQQPTCIRFKTYKPDSFS